MLFLCDFIVILLDFMGFHGDFLRFHGDFAGFLGPRKRFYNSIINFSVRGPGNINYRTKMGHVMEM